ncbi:MAG: hypothetical protein ACW98K_17655 [Candidatus Kariarchaeaceae archaeon]
MKEAKKTRSEAFLEFVEELKQDPRIVRFLYQILLIGSGMILITFLARDGFKVQQTILVMLGWFILVVVFPVPELAKENIEPFNEPIEELEPSN